MNNELMRVDLPRPLWPGGGGGGKEAERGSDERRSRIMLQYFHNKIWQWVFNYDAITH